MTEDVVARSFPVVRRVAGVLAAVLAVSSATLFAFGVWNPRSYVVLRQYFGNPAFGAFVTLTLVAAAVWLLAPVRNEALQHKRVYLRFALVALAVLSATCCGLFRGVFAYDSTVIATSPSGARQVAVVTTSGDEHRLRVWAGTGLAVRDLGTLGLACGNVSARFDGEDAVHVASAYGDFDLRLDHRTGAPLDTIGSKCYG